VTNVPEPTYWTLYIAGPMTGHHLFNYSAFHDAAYNLTIKGHSVANPASLGIRDGKSHSEYLREGIHLLLGCDGVALLDGWENSKGATLEVAIAEALMMPIKSVKEWL
jgi:hypothetical protein